ncbi:hypothetical protein QAD02_007595 [Eretmocerus hayati]|uniref:Uncharacterized protein n=1 Tax=Eretmocerus hayati TaxID=131215 RepID=A0ACC2N451_9HYME|nr:hypothetical protein QAD02_007595 [Eretmocerus hayati]
MPPFMPPFMPPKAASTASIREMRDSETERDQQTTVGGSDDSSGDDAEYIHQRPPPVVQTPVGTRTQETSQEAYAGEMRQRPREDRREQVRTTLPMHGGAGEQGATRQALVPEQASP